MPSRSKRPEQSSPNSKQNGKPPSKKTKTDSPSPDTEQDQEPPKTRSQDRKKDDDDKKEEDEEKDVHWTQRPPYVPENADKPRKAKYTGSCHCKDVTFDVFADPKDAHFCHCDDCQKLHGAPVHWSAIMPKTDILFTVDNPEDKLSFYRTEDNSNEYKLPVKVSCKRCHAMICDEGKNMMLMFPSLIDFNDAKEREPFTPRRHVFYKMRAMDVHDGQEKYEGMQFKSPLMDESAHGEEGITGAGSRKNRDPNEKDSKERSDNPK